MLKEELPSDNLQQIVIDNSAVSEDEFFILEEPLDISSQIERVTNENMVRDILTDSLIPKVLRVADQNLK